MFICIQNRVACNWLWCFGNTGIQSAMDSPHKKNTDSVPWCFSLLFTWAHFWNNSRFAGVEKGIIFYFVYIFIKIQSSPTNSKLLREINYDNNLINFSLRSTYSFRRHKSHAICFGFARAFDLLPPKCSTNMQIQASQLSENDLSLK